ncbi:MAG: hypothetical protein ACR2LK_09980 [Solirubrobacteraceae bacterium]
MYWGVPEHEDVERESERGELVFLAFAVADAADAQQQWGSVSA